MSSDEAIVALASHLSDAEPSVRLAAAFALSRLDAPSEATAEALGTALARALRQDPDQEVRIMAGRALGSLGLGRAPALLAALSKDADWRVRTAAATALGRTGTSGQRARGVKLAWRQLRQQPERLLGPDLHPLMALLAEIGDHPTPGLGSALGLVEAGATEALSAEKLQARRVVLAHLACSAALARDRLSGRARRVRTCGVTAPPVIDEARRSLLVARALEGSTVPGALKTLRRLLRQGDERVKIAAIEAIGKVSTPLRLSVLEAALREQSPNVVAAAATALAEHADAYSTEIVQPAQQLTVTAHTEDGPVTYSLESPEVRGREPPAKALAAALARVDPDRDVETALDLVRAVRQLKATGAAEKLRPLASHHNRTLRRAARRALEALGLVPGAELRPDPPNLVHPAALLRLAATRPRVEVQTTRGAFVITLRPDVAPATVANFLGLVGRHFYDGLLFHRVVPGFVVQTGDPTATGYGGPGYTIRCEINRLRYVRGSVGMALAGPDTGGSQFFITYSAQPHLDGRYTLFGQVTSGMEVVDSLQPWDRIVTIRRLP